MLIREFEEWTVANPASLRFPHASACLLKLSSAHLSTGRRNSRRVCYAAESDDSQQGLASTKQHEISRPSKQMKPTYELTQKMIIKK